MILPDVLAEKLAVVFSATAVSTRSGEKEAYYAGTGNKFWSILSRVRITPRQFRPEEFMLVLAHDIGLVDLVKLRDGVDADLTDADYDVKGFKKKISEHAPAIVAFNGKEAARRVLGLETVRYGRQTVKLGQAVVHVLPSTSPKAHDFWNESHWQALAAEVREARKRL